MNVIAKIGCYFS